VAEPVVSKRIAISVALGTLLNPLNSSMIAVALVSLQGDFHVSLAQATWLVSSFYLAASVGQPLMGRLADRFGPRRVYASGLCLVAATGVLVLLAPGYGFVVAARVLQAVGTSTAYPSGLAVIRRLAGGRPPAGILGTISAANTASAAFGPVLGGVLVSLAGWRGIFAVNIPVAVVALVLALRWLPADPPLARVAPRQLARDLDLPAVALFAVTMLTLLDFVLSLGGRPQWVLLLVLPVTIGQLIWHERNEPDPFLDVRALGANRRLLGVLAQQAATQAMFYLVFFGLPLWLQRVREFKPATAGLLMLPVSALAVVLTPVAARVIRRLGAGMSVLVGSVGLAVGAALLFAIGDESGPVAILAVGSVIGLPVAFNNIGLQAGLYAATPVEHAGLAGGLFQTGRYVGAILSTALLSALFTDGEYSSAGLHQIGLVILVVAGCLAAAAPFTPAPAGRHRASWAGTRAGPAGQGSPEPATPARPDPVASPAGSDHPPA
jgi:MFS family permease